MKMVVILPKLMEYGFPEPPPPPRHPMMERLTEAYVDALTSDGRHDRFVFDIRQSGFAIRVTPVGTKIYVAQAYVGGRKRRVTVGYHPEVSVARARELALQAIANMRRGNDPVAERQ